MSRAQARNRSMVIGALPVLIVCEILRHQRQLLKYHTQPSPLPSPRRSSELALVFLRLLILALALLSLSACSLRNPARVEICLAALTGLEPGPDGLIVDGIDGDGAMIGIDYRRAGEESPARIRCDFEGSALALGQLDLTAVNFNGHDIGPGRLIFLKRDWLTKEGPESVRQRVERPPAGFISLRPVAGQYLQSGLSALPIAAVYVLLSLGFALIHGITGRMNIAHGEFATVGAYAGFAGFMGFGAASAVWGVVGAIVFALVAAGCAGWLTIRAVFIPLARRDGQMLLVACVGLILVYEEFVRLTHASRELWLPPILSDPVALTLPPYVVTVTPMQIAIALSAVLLVAVVFAIMRFSHFGRAWRAVSDDPMAARFMGIDPSQVLAVSAVMAAGLGGMAGLAILLGYGNSNHAMGLMLSIKAMVGALIGGMGSPGGAVLGALVLVAVETFWVVVFGDAYRDVAVFAMLIGLLTLQPNGLFGLARK